MFEEKLAFRNIKIFCVAKARNYICLYVVRRYKQVVLVVLLIACVVGV